jgi:predicted DNA-binding protein
MNDNESVKIVSAPIRMSPELMEKVSEAVKRTGHKQAEILRMCLEIGLEDLSACKYDLPKLVADTARALRSAKTSAPSVITFPEVPLLRAAAGFPILADAEMVEPDRDLGMGRFLLELRGDSMEPRFKHKQRVVLRDKATLKRPVLKYGELYCFVYDGAAAFKQWAKDAEGNKVLRSLNPEHADIQAEEGLDWIGWFDKADNL